jgi:hypothetical protein
LACVDGARMEAILEILTIRTHQSKHLSGRDDAAAQQLLRHAGIGLRGLERRAPPEMGAVQSRGHGPQAFIGRARSRSLYGFVAIDLGCNAHRVERTQRDVRLDGVNHYFVLFQVAGGSTIIQNDRVVQLTVGDAALVESARPGTHVSEERCGQWISLQLPRQSLASHL